MEIISHSVEWLVCLIFWNENSPWVFTRASSQQTESQFCGHSLEVDVCLQKCTHLGINCDFSLITREVIDKFMETKVEWMHLFRSSYLRKHTSVKLRWERLLLTACFLALLCYLEKVEQDVINGGCCVKDYVLLLCISWTASTKWGWALAFQL